MISKEMLGLGTQRSVIREISGYAAKRKQEINPEDVLDFSLGNPNVPAPQEVANAILDIVQGNSPVVYNSYSASNGFDGTRSAIARNLNQRFGTDYGKDDLYMTCGAAASLCISLKAIISSPEEEVIVFAPFFPEYKVYIESRGAKMVLIPAADNFQIHSDDLRKTITLNTKAVIINSPNNPSGVVYSEETIQKLGEILKEKSEEYGHPIWLISDEPYRELVFNDVKVPFVPNYYGNTLVCYSWSKSLSLPGERIGYVLVPPKAQDHKNVMAAVAGAGRALGYVCAPSLFQQVIERCIDVAPDLTVYETNRNLLTEGLEKAGYEYAKPDGAFYMFIKSPFAGGGQELHERAKARDVLLVPGESFGAKDYVRLSYCTSTESVRKAIPILSEIIQEK